MIASKLELSDVPDWVNKELSGYSNGDTLPSYRVLQGQLKARTVRGWIPVQFPTNDLQETVSEKAIFESIAEIEVLSKRDGNLATGFPAEAQQVLQEAFQIHTEFLCFLERTRLEGILDEVRNQVLRWAIELDKAGVKGDGLTFTAAEKEKAHTVIHADTLTIGVVGDVGGQANVATGDQSRAGNIDASDVQKLIEEIGNSIASLNLPPPDNDELSNALAALKVTNPTEPIEAGKVRRALNRVLRVVGKATETVLTVGIKAYTEAWMKQHGIIP
jgi:hypothetical protein